MKRKKKKEGEADPKQDIKDTLAMMADRRMQMMMPIIMWCGFSCAIFGSVFFRLMARTMGHTTDFYG